MAVASFTTEIDPQTGFYVIGRGSLGGKAQGLALAGSLLSRAATLQARYPQVMITIPRTMVIAANGFETFIHENKLGHLIRADNSDDAVAAQFLAGRLPDGLKEELHRHLEKNHYPLAVRSSCVLEDLRYHAYAGLYRTFMLSNDQESLEQRVERLAEAVKLVYASTFFEGPRAYARRAGHQLDASAMAVMVQHVAGLRHGRFYYPAISGVAQSINHYPIGNMKAEDGLATIALGLGRQVVTGERALRFCPKYPKRLLQRSTVEEMLDFAQREFYALEMKNQATWREHQRDHLARRFVADAAEEPPVRLLSGTYVPSEHRIRDTLQLQGQRVLNFANVLKHGLVPLADIIRDLLRLGEQSLGAVEIEFAVDPAFEHARKHQFYLLQMRPMSARGSGLEVTISRNEIKRAVCFSRNAMGNAHLRDIAHVVYIKPAAFDPGRTRDMVRHLAEINAAMQRRTRSYVLVGPGRWGSADPWLGIPVRWADISNVAAIVETTADSLKVEPSQGAHFFHNIISMGIIYFSISRRPPDFFNWPWLMTQPRIRENEYAALVHLKSPMVLKVDGRTSKGIILASAHP